MSTITTVRHPELEAAAQRFTTYAADRTPTAWPTERPAGWPGAWPPEAGPDEIAVAALWAEGRLTIPPGATIDLDVLEKTDFSDLPEDAPPAPLSPAEADANAAWEARDHTARTANGMPDATGWASCKELARRLARSRDYQVLALEMQDSQRRPGGASARDRVRYDLEITKLAARETRYEPHLYDFLDRFSWAHPATGQDGARQAFTAEREGYLLGTIRASLAAGRQGYAAAPVLLDDAALDALPDPVWLIDGLLPEDAGGVLYGRRGTYKSFTLLDWGLSVQTGTPWLDREVRQGQFVYVAAEGWGGLKKRVRAWRRAHDVDGPIGAAFVNGSILRTDQAVEQLIETIRAKTNGAVKLIGLDTLNRLIPGLEENSPEAMGRAVAIVDQIHSALPGATVVWVHHSGWDDAHERGHSSLGDDLDVIFHVEADIEPKTIELTCEKQKDADTGEPLRLVATEDVTADSLTLDMAAGRGVGAGAPLNETETAILDVLVKASAAVGNGTIANDAWFGACVAAKVRVRGKPIERRTFNYNRARLTRKERIDGMVATGFKPRG